MPNSPAAKLYLGIDGGGSKCCAVIVDETGATLGRGMGAAANAYQNLAQTKISVVEAAAQALQNAGLPQARLSDLTAGVGLAGVNVPSVLAAMERWQHPFCSMHLTTDLHIACIGAHKANEGAVIIAGTGSCGYSLVNNKTTIVGGHGFLLGDQGSGAWLGLEAVKAVLLAIDDAGPQTLMRAMLCDYLETHEAMLVDKLTTASSRDYAKLSRVVFTAAQQQDQVAVHIIRAGAAYLDKLAEKLWATKPERMSLIGGLSTHILPWLKPETARLLSPPLAQPEYGAILLVKQS